MKALPLQFTIPTHLPVNRLRDALANSHLPALVVNVAADHIKVTPGQGIPADAVKAFVGGFIAGFAA